MKPIYRGALALLLACSAAMLKAQAACDPEDAIENCTANEAINGLAKRAPARAHAEVDGLVAQSEAKAERGVVNTNRAVASPDPFAANLHATYQDFLVPWSFAISSIDESQDGKALIVRFNPFREPPFVGGLTVTATKPALDADLVEGIPEDKRETATARLDRGLGDLGDLTFAASVATETVECSFGKQGRCWGRNPKTYRQMLSQALRSLLPIEEASSSRADQAALRVSKILQPDAKHPRPLDEKLSEFPAEQRREAIEAIRGLVSADLVDRGEYLAALSERGIGHLEALVDNQPQLAVTGSWRDRDRFVGGKEEAATLELQFGRRNLNRLRRSCQGEFSQCLADSLRSIASGNEEITDKFVLAVSFKQIRGFLVTAADVEVPGFTGIDRPTSREWSAKIQWGQRLNVRVGDQRARLDVAAEGYRLEKGGELRQNDWLARATLTVPVMASLSVPITLQYGNRPDLLTEVRHRWSAHLGISYRLPWDMR